MLSGLVHSFPPLHRNSSIPVVLQLCKRYLAYVPHTWLFIKRKSSNSVPTKEVQQLQVSTPVLSWTEVVIVVCLREYAALSSICVCTCALVRTRPVPEQLSAALWMWRF